MADLLDDIIKSIDSLSDEQLQKLLAVAEAKKSGSKTDASGLVRNPDTGNVVACPHCGSASIIKTGTRNGRQRYRCKDCEKVFTGTTGTLHYYSKLTKAQWQGILKGMVQNLSIRKIADDIGTSPQTVWYNKQRICCALNELFYEQDKLAGIVECDEYVVRLSFKGKRDAGFFVNKLGRLPKHHRSYSEKIEYLKKNGLWEGLQKYPQRLEEILTAKGVQTSLVSEHVSILTCKDRNQDLYMKPVCLGKMENEHVPQHLSGRVDNDALMITDSYAPYRSFAEMENIRIEQILASKHAKGVFNLANINSLHSRLEAFWSTSAERQPATKYIDIQLSLFWWLEKNRDLTTEQQVNKLYAYLAEQYYTVPAFRRMGERPLQLDTKNSIPARV